MGLRVREGDHVEDLHGYTSMVGALQYVTITRPEISFSVNRVCQFMQNPIEEQWKVMKRILRYLQGTLHHGLHLKRSSSLTWLDSMMLTGHLIWMINAQP